MRKPLILLLHLGFWVLYLLLIMAFLYAIFEGRVNPEQVDEEVMATAFFFLAIAPAFITFYAFYLFLFPRFFRQRKFGLSLFYGALIAIGVTSIGYATLAYLIYPECVAEADDAFLPGIVVFLSFTNFLCGMVAFIFQGFFTWFEEVKLKEDLMQKNHTMELALVKSQLDPHFLFNTLNNIDTLILKSAEDASEYLNRLSDIMRFMLYETKTGEIALQREIEYIRKYIALQRIRTANDRYVSFRVDGNAAGKTIAPMVFIPFIENAFKHSPNKKLTDAIQVSIEVTETSLRMLCVNKINQQHNGHKSASGLGDGLIRKRLELLYPQRHELETLNSQGEYRVTLTINT